MSHRMNFNKIKAIEAILFILEQDTNQPWTLHNVSKACYWADRRHLECYGRFIFDDQYIAMDHGPVPSGAYDLMKNDNINMELPFTVQEYNILGKRKHDAFELSQSDIECLQTGAVMSGKHRRNISHDSLYKSIQKNHIIPLESFIEHCRDSEAVREHLEIHDIGF